MAKLLKVLLVVLASLATLAVVLAVATVLLIDSPPVKRFVSDKISQRIGRTLTIDGPLKIDLGLKPRVELNDVTLENAAWANSSHMASIQRLVFRIDIPALVGGRIVFSMIDIDQPVVRLQRSSKGQSNWAFMTAGKSSAGSKQTIPVVQSLNIANGRLIYKAPRRRAPLTVTLDTLKGRLDKAARRLSLDGAGRVNHKPFTLALNSSLKQGSEDQRIPLDATLTLAKTNAEIHGTLAKPMSLQGLNAELHAQVPRPADLAALAGVTLRTWPALQIDGRLVHHDNVWRAIDLVGHMGGGRITGHAAYNAQDKTPLVTVDLKSPQINLAQLTPQKSNHPPPKKSGSLILDVSFHTQRLNGSTAQRDRRDASSQYCQAYNALAAPR